MQDCFCYFEKGSVHRIYAHHTGSREVGRPADAEPENARCVCLDMLSQRNNMAHIYDGNAAGRL